jgi:hypothetical protein
MKLTLAEPNTCERSSGSSNITRGTISRHFLIRRRKGGVIMEPEIATKPDQAFHEGTTGEEEASRCAGGTGSANRLRRQAT